MQQTVPCSLSGLPFVSGPLHLTIGKSVRAPTLDQLRQKCRCSTILGWTRCNSDFIIVAHVFPPPPTFPWPPSLHTKKLQGHVLSSRSRLGVGFWHVSGNSEAWSKLVVAARSPLARLLYCLGHKRIARSIPCPNLWQGCSLTRLPCSFSVT